MWPAEAGCFSRPGPRTATSALRLTSTRRHEPLPRPDAGAEREGAERRAEPPAPGGSPRRLLHRPAPRLGGAAPGTRHTNPRARCSGARRPSVLSTLAHRGGRSPPCGWRREARRGARYQKDPGSGRAGIRAPKSPAPLPPHSLASRARRAVWGGRGSRLGDPSPRTNAGNQGTAWVSAGWV